MHYIQCKNNGTDNVSIEARMLLDSAIGNQDFAYYELPDTSYSSNTIEKECVIKGEEIPATFYAYDDLKIHRQQQVLLFHQREC